MLGKTVQRGVEQTDLVDKPRRRRLEVTNESHCSRQNDVALH